MRQLKALKAFINFFCNKISAKNELNKTYFKKHRQLKCNKAEKLNNSPQIAPEDSRTLRPLFVLRPTRYQPVLHLLCNAPSPNYYQLHFVQKQNYPAEKVGRIHLLEWNPLYLVPSRQGLLEEHIYRLNKAHNLV